MMKQFAKGVCVGVKLLEQAPLDARLDPGDESARQTRFNDSNQRAILFESDERSAEIVRLWHGALHRLVTVPCMPYLPVTP